VRFVGLLLVVLGSAVIYELGLKGNTIAGALADVGRTFMLPGLGQTGLGVAASNAATASDLSGSVLAATPTGGDVSGHSGAIGQP
jgi:hypothetical protein